MGSQIGDIRKKLGITQAELAEKSGVSRVTISTLENGHKNNISTKTLLKIADALGVSVDTIFFAAGVKPA